jgi:hypothetical protein
MSAVLVFLPKFLYFGSSLLGCESDVRNNTAFATASASSRRPRGTVRDIPLSRAPMAWSVGAKGDQIGVLVPPGVA